MNRKLISKALSNIDSELITESLTAPEEAHRAPERTTKMGKYENRNGHIHSRRIMALASAACLVFALAITAYATNWLGIRELFGTYNRKLPESADPYIQQHTEAAVAEDWSARVTESLSDANQILVTVNISGGDKYILAPTDAMPQDTVGLIGLQGDQTLEDYAASQGKELLLVGATLRRNEKLGILSESQRHESISPEEMTILIQSERTESAPAGEVVCHVYAINSQEEKKELDIPFTLTEAPASEGGTFIPVAPDAIPGMTVGEATVTETPLGISVRWMETVTDQDAYYEIMKVEVEGIEFMAGGGAVLEDDGNWYYTASMGQGTISDTMTVHFYDWDKQPIGDIVFKKK